MLFPELLDLIIHITFYVLAAPEREKVNICSCPVIGYRQLEDHRRGYGHGQSDLSGTACTWQALPEDEGRDAHVSGPSKRSEELQGSSEAPSGSLSFNCKF